MRRLAAGSVGLVVAMMLVNAGNYGLNIFLANALDASRFGDASLLVTVLLTTGVLAATLQLATSVATLQAPEYRESQLRSMRLFANRVGWTGGLLLGLTAPLTSSLMQMESSWALLVMAAGFPIHLQLAVERGRLQGDLRLGRLATTFIAEGAARIAATIIVVELAPSVAALAVALNVGFVGGYLVCRPHLGWWSWCDLASPGERPPLGSVGIVFVAVTLLTNVDVVVAKALFEPAVAGGFAALALGGRVVFFASWTLQQALLPIVIADNETFDRRTRQRLFIGANVLVCAVLVLVAWLGASRWISIAFGETYVELASLLGPYALGAGLISTAAAVAVIRSTERNDRAGRLMFFGAFAVTGTLFLSGDTLAAFVHSRLVALVFVAGVVALSGDVSTRLSKSAISSCRSALQGAFS